MHCSRRARHFHTAVYYRQCRSVLQCELNFLIPQVGDYCGNISPTAENVYLTFHMFIVPSYLRKTAELNSIILKFDNVCISLEKNTKNRKAHVSETV